MQTWLGGHTLGAPTKKTCEIDVSFQIKILNLVAVLTI